MLYSPPSWPEVLVPFFQLLSFRILYELSLGFGKLTQMEASSSYFTESLRNSAFVAFIYVGGFMGFFPYGLFLFHFCHSSGFKAYR